MRLCTSIVAVGLMGLLAACGGGSKGENTTPEAAPTEEAAPAEGTEGGEMPAEGGEGGEMPAEGGEANPCGGEANPCGGGQ